MATRLAPAARPIGAPLLGPFLSVAGLFLVVGSTAYSIVELQAYEAENRDLRRSLVESPMTATGSDTTMQTMAPSPAPIASPATTAAANPDPKIEKLETQVASLSTQLGDANREVVLLRGQLEEAKAAQTAAQNDASVCNSNLAGMQSTMQRLQNDYAQLGKRCRVKTKGPAAAPAVPIG